jgi:hypothetical protein
MISMNVKLQMNKSTEIIHALFRNREQHNPLVTSSNVEGHHLQLLHNHNGMNSDFTDKSFINTFSLCMYGRVFSSVYMIASFWFLQQWQGGYKMLFGFTRYTGWAVSCTPY